MTPRWALPVLAAAAALLLPALANAYPQFQLSTGNARCNQCHYSPTGGGLLRSWGRYEAAATVSRGGEGGFLHGLWTPPEYLDLGGDFRFAGMVNDTGSADGAELDVFPMQGDLYVLGTVGDVYAYVSAGLAGSVRDSEASIGDRFWSREHWLMWQPSTEGLYVRAGRYYAPQGLRLAEHPTFVRRYLGLNLYEETYNVSAGMVKEEWELHVTAFTPDFLRDPVGHDGSGGSVYYERRMDEDGTWLLGAQARASFGDHDARFLGGAVGKVWLESLDVLVMGEADVVRQTFDVDGGDRTWLTSYLGATWFPVQGIMGTVAWEHHDPDLRVADTRRDALDLQLHYFPIAHLELLFWGRHQLVAGEDDATTAMLQVHYYL